MDRIDRRPIIQARGTEIAERLRRLGCSERQAALHAERLFKARITVPAPADGEGRESAGNVRTGRKRGWG
jgi:hypothetical protein